MARPGGYSSDELDDDDDLFYDFGDDDRPRKKPTTVPVVKLTPDEQLLAAAQNGDPLGLRQALEEGANVHCTSQGQEKWTAIMWAAYNGDVELIKILLAAGANSNDKFESRSVLIQLCLSQSRDEESLLLCFNLLVQSGAQFDIPDWENTTPLMCACWKNHEKIVRALLELGADLEKANCDRWTPIFFAVDGGHRNIVALLKERGANLEATDRFGKTPEEVALCKDLKEIAELVSTGDNSDDYDVQTNALMKRLSQVDYFLSECSDIRKNRLYGFRSEVIRLLNASNLRMLLPKFVEQDVQLGHLLVWDVLQWEKSGTTQLSFHRKKLASMAQRFHLQPWGKDSVRLVRPGENLTFKDLVQIMCNASRQLHVLSLSTLYCRTYLTDNVDVKDTLKDCLTQSARIRKDLNRIEAKVRKMRDAVETADYISGSGHARVLPATTICLVGLLGLVLTARIVRGKFG